MEDFKDGVNFIKHKRIATMDIKVNSSNHWTEGEKTYLDDVTMDFIPDDDAVKNIKGTTAMKWDAQKKRYILKKVDRDGRVIAEKRNESGVKISKKMREKQAMKKESIYKKWQQRTHLTLQKSGEMEDNKAIDQARRANEARKTLKDFKQRHGQNLYKGQDARSHQPMIEKKK